jgi:hypothetical protein
MYPQTITVELLSIVSIRVILPQDSFTSTGPEKWTIYTMYNEVRCIIPQSSIFTSLVPISWSWITIFPKWLCKRKQKKYDFFKWTVVVNLPILAIPANMQNVAMCWPSANDKWVMGWLGHLAVRWQAYQLLLNCPNHTLTIVLSHSHQKPNSKYPFNFICVFCKRMKAQSH